MIRVLLIYEEIPENLKIWDITGVTAADFEKLSRCHGKLVNIDDPWDEQEWLIEEYMPSLGKPGYECSAMTNKVHHIEPTLSPIYVIHTGFAL